jgi:repressor of nif and glnA expression
VVAITIRPSRDPKSSTGKLLDGNGDVPVANLRSLHLAASDAIQRALEELQRRGLMSTLVVGRHYDALRGSKAVKISRQKHSG